MNTALNLDDTTNCPLGDRCAHCGTTGGLVVATFDTPIGVLCRTICGTCAADDAPRNPFRFSLELNHVVRMVCDHCEHLGIDLDQMAAALDTERNQNGDDQQ
jgi:hypothetical protein